MGMELRDLLSGELLDLRELECGWDDDDDLMMSMTHHIGYSRITSPPL